MPDGPGGVLASEKPDLAVPGQHDRTKASPCPVNDVDLLEPTQRSQAYWRRKSGKERNTERKRKKKKKKEDVYLYSTTGTFIPVPTSINQPTRHPLSLLSSYPPFVLSKSLRTRTNPRFSDKLRSYLYSPPHPLLCRMAKPRRNVKFAHRSSLNTSSDFGGSRRDSLSGDDNTPLSPLRNGVTVDGADSHTGSRSPVPNVLPPPPPP